MDVLPFPKRKTTSWTEVSTRRQCPHKHKLHYIDRWRPAELARPLATGILWHEVMDLHYTSLKETGKIDLEPILLLFKEHGAKDPDHPEHEVSSTVLWMYDGYRKRYGSDTGWKVHMVEEEFRVPLPDTDVVMVGRIDLVVEAKGVKGSHLWLVDHKANANMPNDKDFDLDDQMPIYIWGLRHYYDLKIRGAIFNVARTKQLKRAMTLDERFDRYFTYRTDHELEVTVREAADTIGSAYGEHATHERHTDPQTCKWRCQFLEPCLAGRKAEHLEVQLLEAKGFTQDLEGKQR